MLIPHLDIELSTLCNAACPCCIRYTSNSTVVNKHLNLGYISIGEFKKWFNHDVLNSVKYLRFCGNHGDPGTNPDLIKIIEYLSQFNFSRFQFNTNGGMKTPSFWKELAIACNDLPFETKAIFSIDGIGDTNHIYRRNVDWNKLTENVKSFNTHITNKNVFSVWEYLVFAHNEHQLNEAEKLKYELGFDKIDFKSPINLDNGSDITPIPLLDSYGNITNWIHPTKLDNFKANYLKDDAKIVYNKIELSSEDGFSIDEYWRGEDDKVIEKYKNVKISPRCKKNDFYVEANGDVYQCCFSANGLYKWKKHYLDGKYVPIKMKQQLDYMNNIGFDEYNLNTTTIHSIIKNKFLYNMYNNNWDKSYSENKMLECASICGVENAYDNLFENLDKDIRKKY